MPQQTKITVSKIHEWTLATAFTVLLFAQFNTFIYFGNSIVTSNYYTLIVSALLFSLLVAPLACRKLSLCYGDVAVLALLLYLIANSYFTNSLDSHEFRMAIAYFLIYFSFRIIHSNYPNFREYAIIIVLIAGIYQSLLVMKQLYGFEISNHHRFAVTGSFFNPGPCGIFLAGVLVLAVSVVKNSKLTLDNKLLVSNKNFNSQHNTISVR